MAGRAVQPGRLRRRLTVAFVAVAGFSMAALATGSYAMVSRARFADSLSRAATDVRYQLVLAHQFLPLDQTRTANLLDSFEGSGRHVVLVTAQSVTASNVAFRAEPGDRTRSLAATGQVAFERTGRQLVVGGQIPGSTDQLYVVYAEERIYEDLAQLRTAMLASWAAAVLLAALVGRALARRTLEPVGRASEAAHAIAEGLLATRLPVRNRDEFGAWAESFNRMAEALEAKIAALASAQARERRFTADVAHELRTPVTALVAAASMLREHLQALPDTARRPAEIVVSDVVRLRHLVDELLEISRLDAGQELVSARPTELVALLRAIVASRGWQAQAKVEGEAVTVHTDPRRLERVLANLVANAVEHGGAGVHVRVGPGPSVQVSDRGPGIPAEHLPRLFERFYKSDPARGGSGSGLGLAIALENARLLQADLRVESEVGVGTRFQLTLPVTYRLPDGEATVGSAGHGEAHDTFEEGPS
ncbi:two-component sensor histidine kinase [Rhizocola hellebori]|uniref:histidine kinase n=1 Tax=Rhizocola hellebori TaxID=1392758 RepID=A0A8J3VK54_9ACTN|nr:HAMP domain-containing sensor histidine kinase [Rhizocola hellebori]GIH09177.1 two-component sensor histidine kinase [Rhizocola hellebori]